MTTFLWSKRRYAAVVFVLLLVAMAAEMVVLLAVTALVVGKPLNAAALWWVPGQALAGAIGGVIGVMLVFRRRPPWLRLGQAGVELATGGGDAMFIPWAAVSSSYVRGRWSFTTLVVTSSSPEYVQWRSRRSWRVREQPRDGVLTVKLHLLGMRGGRPAAFRDRGPVDLRTLLPVLSP